MPQTSGIVFCWLQFPSSLTYIIDLYLQMGNKKALIIGCAYRLQEILLWMPKSRINAACEIDSKDGVPIGHWYCIMWSLNSTTLNHWFTRCFCVLTMFIAMLVAHLMSLFGWALSEVLHGAGRCSCTTLTEGGNAWLVHQVCTLCAWH